MGCGIIGMIPKTLIYHFKNSHQFDLGIQNYMREPFNKPIHTVQDMIEPRTKTKPPTSSHLQPQAS